MAIWTSRYSNKELVENKDKYYCVGISLGTPKFPLGYTVEQQCYSLAPKGYMLRMELEKFTEEYYRKLEGIGNDKIINMVMRFEAMAAAKGKELVFLCYEDVRIPEDTIKSGDTLSRIAQKKLGKASRYPEIYKLNKSKIEAAAKKHGRKSSNNGHWIYPGTKLTIPKK